MGSGVWQAWNPFFLIREKKTNVSGSLKGDRTCRMLILVQPQGSQGLRIPHPPVTTKSVSGVPAASSGAARVTPATSSRNIRTPPASHRPTQQSHCVSQTHAAIPWLSYLTCETQIPAPPLPHQSAPERLQTVSIHFLCTFPCLWNSYDIIPLVGLVQGLEIKWEQKLAHKIQVMVLRVSILYHSVIHSVCTYQALF